MPTTPKSNALTHDSYRMYGYSIAQGKLDGFTHRLPDGVGQRLGCVTQLVANLLIVHHCAPSP